MSNLRSQVIKIRERNRLMLEQEQQRIVNELISLGAKKIILFGSLARNDSGMQSDLDLLVVMESKEDFINRVAGIYRLIKPRVATDILVYTPEELARQEKTKPFIRNILKEGVLLYARKTP